MPRLIRLTDRDFRSSEPIKRDSRASKNGQSGSWCLSTRIGQTSQRDFAGCLRLSRYNCATEESAWAPASVLRHSGTNESVGPSKGMKGSDVRPFVSVQPSQVDASQSAAPRTTPCEETPALRVSSASIAAATADQSVGGAGSPRARSMDRSRACCSRCSASMSTRMCSARAPRATCETL